MFGMLLMVAGVAAMAGPGTHSAVGVVGGSILFVIGLLMVLAAVFMLRHDNHR
jgi:Ca2+/Na+ antiporter